MTKASKFRNVYCKLSGLNDEVNFYDVDALRPYVQHCLDSFGPGRCMFGSDWPVCKLSQPFADYSRTMKLMVDLTAHLTAEDRALIFGRTAIQFYGLKL